MSEKSSCAGPMAPSAGGAKKGRTRLAPSQKYEVFTTVLTSSATQREIAEKYRIDRSTIASICRTAKAGAIEALAAAVPGRPRGSSPEAVELAEAKERVARLEKTIAEQAMRLHLIEGKDSWD